VNWDSMSKVYLLTVLRDIINTIGASSTERNLGGKFLPNVDEPAVMDDVVEGGK